jgi:hypothetical protein
MYYERIRKEEPAPEKESDSDIEEQSMNQSSSETHQLTNKNERIQNTGTTYDNYQKKENNILMGKTNVKDYLSPYITKSNFYFNIDNEKKENNYLVKNKNVVNYSQKNLDYNENIVRKNETEVKNYNTEDNEQILSYQQSNTMGKYETKDTKNYPKLNNKEKNTKKLNFSYDEDVSNFDNYNKIKNVKGKKEYIKMEYNNFTFNEKIDNNNNINSKNLKYAYNINNNKNETRKIPDNYIQKKINNYENEDNKDENKENVNMNTFQRKIENKNINFQNTFKNEKDSKIFMKQILNGTSKVNEGQSEEEILSKPNYFFSYDYSTKIKNYDNSNLSKSEFSTALDTAKYKNKQEEKNVEIKEFNIQDNENPEEIKYNNIDNKTYNKNVYESQKENNHINNLRTITTDIINEKSKKSSLINKYIDTNNINNNINETNNSEEKIKYYNSTNNLIIHEMNQNEELSSLLKKDYSNIKIVSAPIENNINNKANKRDNYIRTNPQEEERNKVNITPQKREIEVSYPSAKNNYMIPESNNLNTLESAVIRSLDEEEEIRTLELEKERHRLEELEKEKQKLILEEKERRERIVMEIRRQEIKDIEKKQLMRKKYNEKMKKKKDDEEKLMKIKEEQQRQLREINELKNNRKYDEQKLLLLTEGKLNKKQRKDYMIGLTNHDVNLNQMTFRMGLEENDNEFLINKMQNNNIAKNSKYWNYKNNINNNNGNNSLNKSIENEDNDEENIIKDNNDFEEIENNSEEQEVNKYKSINEIDDFSGNKTFHLDKDIENDIPKINNDKASKTIYKPKNRRINIKNNPLMKDDENNDNNNDNENNEYKTFSPKITHKMNVSMLSPVSELDHSSKKISTELPDISPNKISKEKIVDEINDNNPIVNQEDNIETSIRKDYYEKKKFSFNKRQINKDKTKFTEPKKSSFAKLNELREITSKLASEVEKKIQLINKNKLFSKTKSSPKLSETYSKYDFKQFKYNLDSDTKDNDEINFDKDKITVNKNKLLSQKSYKYNQLIKDIKIEQSNLINNNLYQSSKKKTLVGEHNLPEEIKKECISELKKMETITKKKGKDNIQYNAGKINKLLDNINRNKRIGLSKNYNTTSNLNQKAFYNDYLYGNKKKIQEQEIDQKFLPYYKEIYGEATPEKDL